MGHIEHRHYKGWTITLRCTKRTSSFDMQGKVRYQSAATAELDQSQDSRNWIDPRVQMLDTGSRLFDKPSQCIDELYSEVKDLIDALHR